MQNVHTRALLWSVRLTGPTATNDTSPRCSTEALIDDLHERSDRVCQPAHARFSTSRRSMRYCRPPGLGGTRARGAPRDDRMAPRQSAPARSRSAASAARSRVPARASSDFPIRHRAMVASATAGMIWFSRIRSGVSVFRLSKLPAVDTTTRSSSGTIMIIWPPLPCAAT